MLQPRRDGLGLRARELMEVINHYVVYRFMNRVWLPISAAFATEAAARRYRESLPLDWETEIREVAGD